MLRRCGPGLLAVLLVAGPVAAADPESFSLPELRTQAARSRAEQLKATRDYKAALERLLVLREDEVRRALERLDRTRDLIDRGIVAKKDLEAAERAVTEARGRLDTTWNEAVVAASLIAKVLAYEEVAAAPPLSPGGEQ